MAPRERLIFRGQSKSSDRTSELTGAIQSAAAKSHPHVTQWGRAAQMSPSPRVVVVVSKSVKIMSTPKRSNDRAHGRMRRRNLISAACKHERH